MPPGTGQGPAEAPERSILQERLEARTEERDPRLRRGFVGAGAYPDRAHAAGTDLARRLEKRQESSEKGAREHTSQMAEVRAIRYFPGPWAGGAEELLPVSWFLLWRSNIDWVPDPVTLKREETGGGAKVLGSERFQPERRPERPLPRQLIVKPARMRMRPETLAELRRRPSTEE